MPQASPPLTASFPAVIGPINLYTRLCWVPPRLTKPLKLNSSARTCDAASFAKHPPGVVPEPVYIDRFALSKGLPAIVVRSFIRPSRRALTSRQVQHSAALIPWDGLVLEQMRVGATDEEPFGPSTVRKYRGLIDCVSTRTHSPLPGF